MTRLEEQLAWGGASSGFPQARNKLRSARRLAQSDDQDGCLLPVEEAGIIVQGLARCDRQPDPA